MARLEAGVQLCTSPAGKGKDKGKDKGKEADRRSNTPPGKGNGGGGGGNGSGNGKGKEPDRRAAPTSYKINRVASSQRKGPDHDALVLVSSESSDQGRGTLVHVTGDVGLGMDFNLKQGYSFLSSRSYKSHHLVGTIPQSNLAEFLRIARSIAPPHDADVMYGKAATQNCTTWINDLLRATQHLKSS